MFACLVIGCGYINQAKQQLTCKTCNGNGLCNLCRGSGKGMLWGQCNNCGGAGQCKTCNGMGFVLGK